MTCPDSSGLVEPLWVSSSPAPRSLALLWGAALCPPLLTCPLFTCPAARVCGITRVRTDRQQPCLSQVGIIIPVKFCIHSHLYSEGSVCLPVLQNWGM